MIICRPINGIGINGLEYLLDENDEPIEFDTVLDAMTFLRSNNVSQEEISEMKFIA
jgi:hypothetical protein